LTGKKTEVFRGGGQKESRQKSKEEQEFGVDKYLGKKSLGEEGKRPRRLLVGPLHKKAETEGGVRSGRSFLLVKKDPSKR